MIDFIFKRKPIYLDCFTSNIMAHEFTPIQSANMFVPDWWKALPKTFYEEGHSPPIPFTTMRRCAGLIDVYSTGLIVPLWSDLIIDVRTVGGYSWKFADEETRNEPHNSKQSGTLLDDANVYHMKIISPWLFSCKEDVKWYFTQPLWNQNLGRDFCIPSGVLEFKYQNSAHINTLIRRQDIVISMSQGYPLAHVVPLSERPVKVKNHLLSADEMNKRQPTYRSVTFVSSYYKKRKLMQAKESKCPFGFKGEK
jgi:hypothetical protein